MGAQGLVALSSSADPSCRAAGGLHLRLLLLPPRSQDPIPSSAPQEATDGSKVAEPSGELLSTHSPSCPPHPQPSHTQLSPGLVHTWS